MAATSRFSIAATISMLDKVTGPMKKASKSVTGFSRKMQAQFRRADISASRINKSINRVGGRAAKIGMAGLALGTGLVVRQFVQFDDAIFAASAKFKGLDITTKAGMKTMEQLRKTARKVGADTKFNAVEAASGLDFLALAGFNATQAMVALPGVVSLATVANIDLATSTDIATDTLGAFNLMTDDAVQLQKNLTRVSDVLAKTTATSNTTLVDLFEAVKKGAPTFTAAGQSIESFSALAGVMANAGVKGTESGTALRNVMLRLSAPVGKASGLLRNMNINIKDSEGNFRDVIDILADFEKGTQGMGTATKTAALSTIFGARAVTGVNILLAEGTDKLKTYRDELLNSGGAAKKMADIIEQSLGNKLKALGSALTEFGFKIIESFAGQGKQGIDILTNAIRSIDPTPIVETLKVIGSFIKLLLPLVPLIVGFVAVIKTIVIATKAWAAIQTIMNFLLAANPIGLIILGVGMLVVAIRNLIVNWAIVTQRFKVGFLEIMLDIKRTRQVFLSLMETIGLATGEDIRRAGEGLLETTINLIEARKKLGAIEKTEVGAFEFGPAAQQKQLQRQQILQGFASPESRAISTTNTTTTNGNLNVNFKNTPQGTTVEEKGQMPAGTTLNVGFEGS